MHDRITGNYALEILGEFARHDGKLQLFKAMSQAKFQPATLRLAE